MVSMKPAPPAVAELGASDVMAGGGRAAGRLWMAIATGANPAGKGEPGSGVRAPLLVLMAYAETLLEGLIVRLVPA
jgi:hypothetical protein